MAALQNNQHIQIQINLLLILCTGVYLSVCQSFYISVYLVVYLSIYLAENLSVYPFVINALHSKKKCVSIHTQRY